MLSEKERNILVNRASKFFRELDNDLFYESRTFTAELGASELPVAWKDRKSLSYSPIREGDVWGKLWDSAWLKLHGEIPAEWQGKAVSCRLRMGGEGLIFDNAGVPVYSLTNTCVFVSQYRKELYHLSNKASSGAFDLEIELAANGLFGDEYNPDCVGQINNEIAKIVHLKYGLFNADVWHLKLEVEVIFGLLMLPRVVGDCVYGSTAFPKNSRAEVRLLTLLNKAIDAYADNPHNAAKAREILKPALKARALDSAMKVTAVGHAHIDTGWLWPVRESIRKCARTFSSQLYLMDRYPNYVFGASQAQHYAFVKEHYPELYAKIKQRVAEGRWELQGGMWVECDCNLVNGESMIRQFVHGKNYFLDEFGVEVKNLWLPDVFGYSAALPQVIRKTGCDHFLTQKISWSQYNKFPYHAFKWYGLGNYEVLSFFPPEDNYNAMLVPDQLNYGADNLSENVIIDEYLSLFGIGDGGGGPKEEFLERGLLCADLEGSPKVSFGRADDFLSRLDKKAELLPEWHGELYLELHRGTLTTQAQVKRDNRRCEQSLTGLEFLLSCLPMDKYPVREMDGLWKMMLLNQFHDILPGSSIKEVYDVAKREHAAILKDSSFLAFQAGAELCTEDDSAMTLVNTLSYPYRRLIELPADWQGVEGLTAEKVGGKVFTQVEISPQSSCVLRRAAKSVEAIESADLTLENALIRYSFNPQGRLIEAFDKQANRQIMAAPGNLFSLYVDIPNSCDAWDVDLTYENVKVEDLAGRQEGKKTTGPLSQRLAFSYATDKSAVTQAITLRNDSRALEFSTHVEWHETHRMLRVAFPTNLVAEEAAFDIQYGYIKRPTHRNTSWDKAMFEVVGQRYADLSEPEYGAALLNDCKYGYKVHGGTIDLNLLRSPVWPDPTADRGSHDFTYVFLPHEGELIVSDVMSESAGLNRAPIMLKGRNGEIKMPVRMVSSGGVTLEVTKRAEKSDTVIFRLVETRGRRSSCKLELAPTIATVVETDMLERDQTPPSAAKNGCLELTLEPFEIKTFRCK